MEITNTAFANDVYSFLWSLTHGMMSAKNSFYVGSYKLLSKEKAPFLSWLRVAANKMSGAQKQQTFNNSNSEQLKKHPPPIYLANAGVPSYKMPTLLSLQ